MSAARPFGTIAILALALMLSGASCNDDHESVLIVPALEIRSTTPADEVVLDLAPGERITLSVDFRRAPVSDSVVFEIYPPALSTGEFGPGPDRVNWSWRDVELDPDGLTTSWLINSPQMRQPVVVRLPAVGTNLLTGFSGSIFSPDSTLVKARGTMVFSIDNNAPFNAIDPRSFVDCVPRSLDVAREAEDAREADYAITYAALFDTVMVVAIKDTNRDAVYDPSTDWWGYRRVPGQVAPEFVITSSPAIPFPPEEYRSDVNIVLNPPFVPAESR